MPRSIEGVKSRCRARQRIVRLEHHRTNVGHRWASRGTRSSRCCSGCSRRRDNRPTAGAAGAPHCPVTDSAHFRGLQLYARIGRVDGRIEGGQSARDVILDPSHVLIRVAVRRTRAPARALPGRQRRGRRRAHAAHRGHRRGRTVPARNELAAPVRAFSSPPMPGMLPRSNSSISSWSSLSTAV